MKRVFRLYFSVPLVWRIVAAFLLGTAAGIGCRYASEELFFRVTAVLAPFGTVLIAMLKMVVIPIIFLSLVTGAASLPLRKFGRLGAWVIVWYLATSLFASVFGTGLALFLNPRMEGAAAPSARLLGQVDHLRMGGGGSGGGALSQLIADLFMNPFQALAEGKFLSIIVFSILFGIAVRTVIEESSDGKLRATLESLLDLSQAALKACFRMIDWIMEYFPIGVLALSAVNFAQYGVELFGPYLRIAGCVIVGVILMLLVIYPLMVLIACRENPFRLLRAIREPVLTAFLTRSSAAALPVSMRVAQEDLRIRSELSGFALPLGATINMDGVCIHLPVFAILAANLFDIPLGLGEIMVLILSVVFASIGTGGIPGGSIFLLFMVLENMGLAPEQTAMVVALAIGINPLLDMFETACNVAGDNIGNYVIARRNGMIGETHPSPAVCRQQEQDISGL